MKTPRRWLYIFLLSQVSILVAAPLPPDAMVTSVTGAQATKVVVAEQFTGTWCVFCPGSSGALERVEDDIGRENLIILAYHNAAGRSDPFHTTESAARAGSYNVSGYPTVIFNGVYWVTGGDVNPNNTAIDREYVRRYDQVRRFRQRVEMDMTGRILMEDPSRYVADCQVIVTATDRVPKNTVVHFVLYEDDLQFEAPNGETHFDWVVRDMLEPTPLAISAAGEQEEFTRRFVIDPRWNRANLGVVAFVQTNGRPPEILQAARVEF